MAFSFLTSKGQTTIPKAVRKALSLNPHDKILYIIEKDSVIIQPVRGNILELRGSFSIKRKPINFKKIRQKTKEIISHKLRGISSER